MYGDEEIMKVHFVSPPSTEKGKLFERLYGCGYAIFNQQNISILYVATLLQERGFKIEVTDCQVDSISNFHSLIKCDHADAYVFYSVFLTRKADLQASGAIQKIKGEIPIVFMGTDPTYDPQAYLTSSNSFVVRGEPEYTILELFENLENHGNLFKVEGVSCVDNERIVHNAPRELITNLDSLPVPNRELLKCPYRYYNPKFSRPPSSVILTSRGCPYRCMFCVPNSLSFAREIEFKRYHGLKPPPTLRSAENVVAEFVQIADQGYKSVQIADDLFTISRKRAIQICKGIKHLGLEIACLSRADHVADDMLVKAFATANVRNVDLGVESFDQSILNYMKKDLRVENSHRAVRLLKQYGIRVELNILLGSCPLETKETIKKTIKTAEALKPDVLHVSICTPFPGTEFHELAKQQGWMITQDYVPVDPFKESLISYQHLSKDDLESYAMQTYREFYFSPRYILAQIPRLRSIKGFAGNIRAVLTMRKTINPHER